MSDNQRDFPHIYNRHSWFVYISGSFYHDKAKETQAEVKNCHERATSMTEI